MKWLPQQPVTVKGDPASKAFLEYLQGLGGPTAPSWGTITGTLSDQTDLNTALNGKQATLVSGTNIKTVNGNSLLGSGDLVIAAGMTLLGTITTTSGASQSLSSLVLTPYKFLVCTVDNVSFSGGAHLRIDGIQCSIATGGAAGVILGVLHLDLANGIFSSNVSTAGAGSVWVGDTAYTTATTTITFSASAGSFDAGSIRVYGVA